MATARKNLADYPPEYMRLIDRALTGRKVVLVSSSKQKAENNRRLLYAFRTTLLREEKFSEFHEDFRNLRFSVNRLALTITLES